jgi:hypothetical protein
MEHMEGLCSTPSISIWAPNMQTRRWHQLRPIIEVDLVSWLHRPDNYCSLQPEPMLQEASMQNNNNLLLMWQAADGATASQEQDWGPEMQDVDSGAILTQASQEYPARAEQGETMLVAPASQVQPQASPYVPPEDVQVESHNGTDKNLQIFLQEVSKPAPTTILKTPAKKSPTRQANEAPTVRRSGRLAAKSKSKGRKTVEELAQEILCSKLEGLPDPKCSKDQVLRKLWMPLKICSR